MEDIQKRQKAFCKLCTTLVVISMQCQWYNFCSLLTSVENHLTLFLQAAIWQQLWAVKKCWNLSSSPRLFLMPSNYASRPSTFFKKIKKFKKKRWFLLKNSWWMSNKVAIHVKHFTQAVFPSGNFSMKDSVLQLIWLWVFFNWPVIKTVGHQSIEFKIYLRTVHRLMSIWNVTVRPYGL